MDTHKEYCKQYYEAHKERIKKNVARTNKLRIESQELPILLRKLNNNEYQRIPHKMLKKYNIVKTDDGYAVQVSETS